MNGKTIRALFVAFLALFPAAALAQYVSGSFGFNVSPNDNVSITFTCLGTPSCGGTYTITERAPQCTNVILETASFSMTGLALAQSGTIQGNVTLKGAENTLTRHPDGTCTIAPGATDAVLPYTGVWNATNRTGTITIAGGQHTLTGNFTAEGNPNASVAPIFQLGVTASIGPVTSNASFGLVFRPQDVGKSGGVFVFASAPQSKVQGALAVKTMKLGMSTKAGTPCVLAQVNPAGQLVAVSTSQLQALVTGLFSAAGAAGNILNNVPTSNVAGATLYVGYGANAGAMLDEGLFRNAVLIPGDATCPMLPYTTALWLHPLEAGWGLNVIQQGSTAFATLFTYDAARQPLWLLMSGGQLQSDGLTFSGDLYRTTGPAFNSNPFTPIGSPNYSRVGTMSITLSHANAALLRYSVNGVEVQKSITRFQFGTRTANCMPTSDDRSSSTNYTDLWWKADESGWGLNITHQDNILFGTLFTYAAGAGSTNQGLWLVMSNGSRQADGSYSGELRRTTGPAFNAVPFTPITAADQTVVGTMRLRFSNGNNGTLEYTVNGVSVTKPITRIPFDVPMAACI